MKHPVVISFVKNTRAEKIGYVIKATGKTLKVTTRTRIKHKVTGKYNNTRYKYTVHDEKEEASVGDKISFAYYRPISKTKSQVLTKVHKTDDSSKTKLSIADNTGAKLAECIRSSQNNTTYASVGQVITVSIKHVSSNSKVKKGEVHKAVIVRVKKPILRRSGHVIYFSDNAVVLLKGDKTTPIGTRILGTVASELRYKFMHLISIAKEII